MTKLLYVGGIPYSTTKEELYNSFSRFGKVNSVVVVIDKLSQRSKGFGFVEMENSEIAISNLHDKNFQGRNLTVNLLRSLPKHLTNILKDTPIVQFSEELFVPTNKLAISSKSTPIIQLSEEVSLSLIQYLNMNPDELYNLTSRKFEELVAELFRGIGDYNVELTKQTRDGGKDIIVTSKGEIDLVFYVECKKYRKNNLVSIDIARNFHSVIISDKVNKGFLATTSYFTKDAMVLINNNGKLMEPVDYNGILNWMSVYIAKKGMA